MRDERAAHEAADHYEALARDAPVRLQIAKWRLVTPEHKGRPHEFGRDRICIHCNLQAIDLMTDNKPVCTGVTHNV